MRLFRSFTINDKLINYDKLIEIMNNEMKKVDIWLQANCMVINPEKRHYYGLS